MDDFLKRLGEVKSDRIAILLHKNADPDAVGGGFALYSLIKKAFPEKELKITGDDVSIISKKVINELSIPFTRDLQEFGPDCLILFDVSNPELLGKNKALLNSNRPLFIIDHHFETRESKSLSDWAFIDSNATSASELVFQMYDALDIEISPLEARAILLGMVYDSRHFLIANEKTFEIASKILKLGVDYNETLQLLKTEMESSEKVARLKAAQRMTLHQIGIYIVVFSQVSAFEASACRALMGLGAEVAFVFLERKDEIRISARSAQKFYKHTGIHLGRDIMEKVGPIIGGAGGGHACAAGCNGRQNLTAAKEFILNYLESELQKQG